MESVPGQGNWSNLSGDLYNILTGGLQGALDLELEKGRARIGDQSVEGDTPIYVRSADDTTVRAGQPASGLSLNNPLVLVVGGVLLLGVVYLVAKG